MSSSGSNKEQLLDLITKQNEQFLAQKDLIEKQLVFARNIQIKALNISIDKLTTETEKKKNVNNSTKPSGVVHDAAKVNVLNDTREMFGINAFNKSMDEKYNNKK